MLEYDSVPLNRTRPRFCTEHGRDIAGFAPQCCTALPRDIAGFAHPMLYRMGSVH